MDSGPILEGLISPPSEPPSEIMSFGVSPVKYSELLTQTKSLNVCLHFAVRISRFSR